MAGRKWRVFNFVVEVAVESPGDVDEEEAAEDAAEFMTSIGRSKGRVHQSFCSITRTDEYGAHRPEGSVVFITDYPKGKQTQLELPRGIKITDKYEDVMKQKPSKAKPKKANKKKSTKKNVRF